MKIEKYVLRNRVAEDYIEAVLEDVEKVCPGKISHLYHLRVLNNFREHFAKREYLNSAQIIQGENEINLALEIYNQTRAKRNLN